MIFVVGGIFFSFFSKKFFKPYQYWGQDVSVVKPKHLTKYEVSLVIEAF